MIVRFGAALAALLVSLSPAAAEFRVSSERISLDGGPLDRYPPPSTGRLAYRGGLVLKSGQSGFGGWSALMVAPDGQTATAISDGASWMRLRLRYAEDGRLIGADGIDFGRLRDADGHPPVDRNRRDTESVTPYGDGILMAHEGEHRLSFRTTLNQPAQDLPVPPSLLSATKNGGVEALTALRDGTLVMLGERTRDAAGHFLGWRGRPGKWNVFRVQSTGLFRPTGAATLPTGDILLLERQFSPLGGLAARISKIPRSSLESRAPVKSIEFGRLESPLETDNFEGIDVVTSIRGRTHVYLISDDNFLPVQRTLLFMFELDQP